MILNILKIFFRKGQIIRIAKTLIFIFFTLLILFSRSYSLAGEFNKPMLTFRFDDGYSSQIPALKYLHKKNMTASIYIISNYIDINSYITLNDLMRIQKYNFEIGSHSLTHPNLALIGKKKLLHEIGDSKISLQKYGINSSSMAYPYGCILPWQLDVIGTNYNYACVYPQMHIGGYNNTQTNPLRIKCYSPTSYADFENLLCEAIEKNLWLVVCFHKIDQNGEKYNIPLSEFKKMADLADAMTKIKCLDVVTISDGAKHLEK